MHQRLDVKAQRGHNFINVVAVELAKNGCFARIV